MTSVTLHAVVSDTIGHYGNAAKSLVAAGRTVSQRALAATGRNYAKFVERTALPMIGDEGKTRIVAAERRIADAVDKGVVRLAEGYDRGIAFVSNQALKSLDTFAQRTDWAKNMFVVDTVRRINLPAAKLSLSVAKRVDDLASTLNTKAKGRSAKAVAKSPAKKARVAKRVRHAA